MAKYNTYNIDFLENSEFGFPKFTSIEVTERFNTREEYLAWRAEWKKAYKELSKQIRHAKQNRSPLRMKDATFSADDWQLRAQKGRDYANQMLGYLREAKKHAGVLRAERIKQEEMEAA